MSSRTAGADVAARASLCAAIGLVLLLPACRGDGPAGSSPTVDPDRPVAYETQVLERTDGDCDEEAAASCARFRVEYPKITAAPNDELVVSLNGAVREMLLNPALGPPAPTPRAMAELFFMRWRETRRAFPDAASAAGWFVDNRFRVIHQDRRLISFEFAEQAYTGGAHPNSATRYASFGIANGRRISLDDLLVGGRSARLNEIAERRFRRLHGVPQERSLVDAGFWFEGDAFALNDNFAVTEAGLLFYYNPYEVTAYVVGPTGLQLTLEELDGLVLPGGPLDRTD